MAAPEYGQKTISHLLSAVEKAGKPAQHDKGEVIYEAGQTADSLYVVTKGTIITRREKPYEAIRPVDTVAKPVELFGVESIQRGSTYDSTALALEPSHVLGIPKANILEAFSADPELFLSILAAQIEVQESRYMLTSNGTSQQKIEGALTALYGKHIPHNPNQRRVSEVAGIALKTVTNNIHSVLRRKDQFPQF